ncbi:hypothetical protein K501DRAFT_288544 [Backusella circina FSU 941]|nr:hypothetical protein K501DRAFT_288544 [Backusella circina FSU 941]
MTLNTNRYPDFYMILQLYFSMIGAFLLILPHKISGNWSFPSFLTKNQIHMPKYL